MDKSEKNVFFNFDSEFHVQLLRVSWFVETMVNCLWHDKICHNKFLLFASLLFYDWNVGNIGKKAFENKVSLQKVHKGH